MKATSLHKASLLYVKERMNAAKACTRDGYESSSQLSRELKSFFGRTPQEVLARRAFASNMDGCCKLSTFLS